MAEASTASSDWVRLLGGLRHWYRLVASASPGAHVVELDGVQATVVPAVPERSVFNAVVYGEAERLGDALPALSDAYQRAGVEAWTVWVPDGDPARDLLAGAGHRLDATPAAMTRELDGLRRPGAGTLDDWTAEGEPSAAAEVNDRAFPFGDDSFARGISGLDTAATRVYLGRVEGRAVAATLVSEHERNAEIDCVAVVPEARGRGLSAELMGHALVDARERGMETTTLVATALGRPVYERLGYRSIGPIEMWERRTTQPRPR
jgi:GNAT superfamily N-acetyltransferase